MKFATLALIGALACILGADALPQLVGGSVGGQLTSLGFENVGHGKLALVSTSIPATWNAALNYCQSIYPGATLFNVNSAYDSNWLGTRINQEKASLSGSSKFWVGLTSQSVHGPLQWLDGTAYVSYPDVAAVSGYDDETKNFAWAVPDSGTKIKYEFLTSEDETEAFICQFIL